jgi:ABC-type nitrate/sulfonate/bicarbonate transport system substrate-binding protein
MARKGFKILKRSGDVIDASPFNGLVTTRDKIQKHPDRLRNTLKAMLEAIRSIRQDRKAVIAYIMESFAVDQGVAQNAADIINKYLEMINGRGDRTSP